MMMTHLRQLGLFFGKDNFNLNTALLLMIHLLFFKEHLLLGLFLSSSSTFWSTFLFPHLYTWMIFSNTLVEVFLSEGIHKRLALKSVSAV